MLKLDYHRDPDRNSHLLYAGLLGVREREWNSDFLILSLVLFLLFCVFFCMLYYILLPFLISLMGQLRLTAHIIRLASEFGLFVELLKCYIHY